MTRTDIINSLIGKIEAKSYLEIGVREPEGNYNKIVCENKVAVDPVPLGPGIIALTSDAFFKQNESMFDVIFIDGLHVADQVERDIINSLAVLNPGGYIICHDMNPTEELRVIQRGYQEKVSLNGLKLTYSNLVSNRKEWLNLIDSNMLYEL